ncbi:MAG: hypothetical protein AAF629_31780, partial [Chloroflexota bacterium]
MNDRVSPYFRHGKPNIAEIIVIWLVLRLVTGVWAALVSPLRPMTALEKTVALWPPSLPWASWLERFFLSPWYRWDVIYYQAIVVQGYRLDDGTAQFHPLYPWLAMPLAWLTDQALFSLLVTGSLATLGLMIAFSYLAVLDIGSKNRTLSLCYFLLFPAAFIFLAPYTESLFLMWAVLSFYGARKKRWWLAGVAGMLATLTRQQGIFLALPLIWELWEASERNYRQAFRAWRNWLTVAYIPAGLLIWIIYRAFVLQDVEPDYSSIDALIYSVVISPDSSKVVPEQAFWWPWDALLFAFRHLLQSRELSLIIDLVLATWFLLYTLLSWNAMRISYRIYVVSIIAISFAYHTGSFYPYMGLPRHLVLAFPVFIGLGKKITYRWQKQTILAISLIAYLFLIVLYV